MELSTKMRETTVNGKTYTENEVKMLKENEAKYWAEHAHEKLSLTYMFSAYRFSDIETNLLHMYTKNNAEARTANAWTYFSWRVLFGLPHGVIETYSTPSDIISRIYDDMLVLRYVYMFLLETATPYVMAKLAGTPEGDPYQLYCAMKYLKDNK